MPNSSYVDYIVQDALGHITGITSRAMFGGWGLYKNGVIFAIIADDELYLKVDDTNRKAYEAVGSHPFVYAAKNNKSATMSYWLVPSEVLDDQDKITDWVEQSVQVSLNSKKKKR